MNKSQNEPQRVIKIESFISKYNCKGNFFSLETDDWNSYINTLLNCNIHVPMYAGLLSIHLTLT